jgi:hypothetical protein
VKEEEGAEKEETQISIEGKPVRQVELIATRSEG